MGKLTLHVDDDLIVAAKDEAVARKTSVSKLVSDFFRILSVDDRKDGEVGLPPITESLLGSIRGSDVEKSDYIDHLERKHS